MFSPENFYFVMRENIRAINAGHLLTPVFDGKKDLFWWHHWDVDEKVPKNLLDRSLGQSWLMYDQEPVFPSCADIYRRQLSDCTEYRLHDRIHQANFCDIITSMRRFAHVPIWCHSEINSQEILDIEQGLYVSCYYWYHALIARDWFRHWRYNHQLQPRNKSESGWRFLLYAREFTGTREYRTELIDGLRDIKSSVSYDWDRQRIIGADYSAKIDPSDADSSAIHLIAETLFDCEKIHLTEKVFKPMVMSQAFLLWGPPGSLRYLREYGFRTFDCVWDEAYDEETNHDKRMEMLLQLVRQLDGLSKEQFHDLYQKCLPIIQHNRDWFYSDAFADRCWLELTRNLETAIEKRNDLSVQYPGGSLFYLMMEKNPGLSEIAWNRASMINVLNQLSESSRRLIMIKYPRISAL